MLPEEPQDAPVPDPTAAPSSPLVTIPLSDDDLKYWQGELTRSADRTKRISPSWDRNMRSYAPDPTNEKWGEEINPGVDFYQVEQKKGQLFYDTPTVIYTPKPDSDPSLLPAVLKEQSRMNDKLSRKGLDAKALMDEVLFDILCPAGMGFTKIGYTNVSRPTPLPAMEGAEPQMAPVPIFEDVFWERFSPKKGRIPTNFHSTQFDKAPWLGERFTVSKRVAMRQYQLPEDFDKVTKKDEDLLKTPGLDTDDSGEEQISGTEIWYKAALYDDAELHPQKIRQLVLIDGLDEPAVHRDSPYQTFDAQGKLTPDSMIGFPIHVFTIRNVADSAYVPSDCTVTRPLVNELSLFRTQLVNNRDAGTSIRIANERVFSTEQMSKVVRGPFGAILTLPEADWNTIDPARPPIMEIAKPSLGRESFLSQDKIEGDLAKVTAMSANQNSQQQDHGTSATEVTYIQRSADVRLQAERNKFAACFLNGVQKVDALLQRYPENGQPSAALGRYTYDIKPDSGMHVDAAADRKFAMDVYNFLAKDQSINRSELLKELLPLMHLDPNTLIVQPPEPKPEPPKVSFIVKGEDLSPLAPQYANMIQALAESGMKLQATPITPELVTNAALAKPIKPAAPAHPGSAPMADKVNQHASENSGQMPNFGGQAGTH